MTSATAEPTSYSDETLLSSEIRMSPELFHFVKEEWHLYFDRANHRWARVNDSGKAIVEILHENGSLPRAIETICETFGATEEQVRPAVLDFTRNMLKSKMFSLGTHVSRNIEYYYDDTVRPKVVFYANTELCNLKCTYCYNLEEREAYKDYKKQMSTEEALSVMRDLAEFGTKAIAFCGGEPLVRKDTIPVARYVKKLGMSPCLITNATLIKEENVAEICELFDLVWISLDGRNAEEHERTRGPATFGPTMKAIELISEYKRAHGKPGTFIVNSVVTMDNFRGMPELKKYLTETLAVDQHRAVLYDSMYSEKKGYDDKVIRSIMDDRKLLDELQVNEIELANCSNEMPRLEFDVHDRMVIQEAGRKFHCGFAAGDAYLASNGDLYPCQLFYHKEFRAGNVLEDGVEEVYLRSKVMKECREVTVDTIDVCKSCAVKYVCGGGCRAIAWGRYGDLRAHDHKACKMLKKSAINNLWSDAKVPSDHFDEVKEQYEAGLGRIDDYTRSRDEALGTEEHRQELEALEREILASEQTIEHRDPRGIAV